MGWRATGGRLGTQRAGERSRTGDWLVVSGVVLTTAGVLAGLLDLVPVFLGSGTIAPVVRWLVGLIPLGLVLSVIGLSRRPRGAAHLAPVQSAVPSRDR